MEHKVKLQYGYKDDKGILHRDVTFGRRLTGGDLMSIDNDPQSRSRTQYGDLIRRRAMTKFGKLKIMPPALPILLGLNKIDRGDLERGYEEFAAKGREGRENAFLPDNKVRLYWGFEIEGVRYPLVELNGMTTGMDEVAADTLGLEGLSRELFILGRSISKISTLDDPPITKEGPIDLSAFQDLDGDDIIALRQGGLLAEMFFRISGKEVSKKRDGEDGPNTDEGTADVGGGNTEHADAAAK